MISKQEALAKEIAEKIPQQSKVISDLEVQLKKQEEEMEAMMAELQEKEARIAELAKSNKIPDSEKLLMSALSDMDSIRATKMPTGNVVVHAVNNAIQEEDDEDEDYNYEPSQAEIEWYKDIDVDELVQSVMGSDSDEEEKTN